MVLLDMEFIFPWSTRFLDVVLKSSRPPQQRWRACENGSRNNPTIVTRETKSNKPCPIVQILLEMIEMIEGDCLSCRHLWVLDCTNKASLFWKKKACCIAIYLFSLLLIEKTLFTNFVSLQTILSKNKRGTDGTWTHDLLFTRQALLPIELRRLHYFRLLLEETMRRLKRNRKENLLVLQHWSWFLIINNEVRTFIPARNYPQPNQSKRQLLSYFL